MVMFSREKIPNDPHSCLQVVLEGYNEFPIGYFLWGILQSGVMRKCGPKIMILLSPLTTTTVYYIVHPIEYRRIKKTYCPFPNSKQN